MFEGVIDRWFAKGRYGFINYRNSGADCRIFFPASSIRKDYLGRVGHSTFEGALVRFKIDPTIYKGHPTDTAIDVHAVFEDTLATSVREHREVSQVVKINGGGCSAWLCREDGSHLFFHKNSVLPEFLDRLAELRVNDYVYHGVECNETGSWAATCGELFSREENEKLRRGEFLTDPESEHRVEVKANTMPDTKPGTVLSPSTRSLSLAEIIRRRKT